MTVTSSTTAVALFANIFSPIMPIRAFGIFSGVLIPVNFFLVVMMMPPAVIFYEKKVKETTCCGIFEKKDDTTKVEDLTAKKPAQLSKVEIFFDERWNTFVYKGRYIILVTSLAWFIVSCIFALKMGP